MKKFGIGVLIALASFVSRADYLLWFTVSNNDDGYGAVVSYLNELKANSAITDSDDVYASVYATDASGNRMGEVSSGLTSEWQIDSGASVSLNELLGDNYGNRESYSYYIEIASSSEQLKSWERRIGYTTQGQTYTALVQNGSITEEMAEVPAAALWHGGGYRAVPEPTSAMLLLLGAASLMLRRKQRKSE